MVGKGFVGLTKSKPNVEYVYGENILYSSSGRDVSRPYERLVRMVEAEIEAIMRKIKAAYWNRQLIDAELREAVRSPEMMTILFERLGSNEFVDINEVGFALAEIVGEGAKAALIDALSSDRWQVRAAAAEALGHYKDFQLTHYLIPLLNDPQQPVRISVTEALEGLRDPSAVPSLIEAIKDINRHISIYATYALYEIAEEYEIPELFPYLKSDDAHLRVVTAYVLGAKGGKDAVRGLIDLVRVGMRGDKTEYERARKELRLIGRPAVEALIEALDERDVMPSLLAIEVLAPLGDIRALPHIVAAMGDENDQVYEAATWGASTFGEVAIPLLLESIKSENLRPRANVAAALGEIGDTKITEDLVGLLKDSDADVRRAALLALEDIGNFDAVPHIILLLKGSAQDAHQQPTTASYAAQVLRRKLSTPEGLAAVERWRQEQGGKSV